MLRKIKKAGLDGFLLIKHEALANENVRYITGFTGSSAYVLISTETRLLLTDDRYLEQAADECPEFKIVRHGMPFTKELAKALSSIPGLAKVGFDKDGVTVGLFDTISASLPGVEMVPMSGTIEEQRAVKNVDEIELIARASDITAKGFHHIIGHIRPGVTEKEIALELEYHMRDIGASALAFDIIVVSGKRSSRQHGRPTEKRVEVGGYVTLDFGAAFMGYRSDMTRTVVVGHATDKQREVYETVRVAQQRGLELLRAGVMGAKASAEVRSVIEAAGYGDYTGLGIGHGVGLQIHEAPYIRSSGDLVLRSGNVVTVEPGIYIPGWGGVRIEDTVVITDTGCRVLTKAPKELLIL